MGRPFPADVGSSIIGPVSSQGRKPENRVSAALHKVQAGAERLEAASAALALWGGGLGIAALVACGVLALLPPERWPGLLDPDRWSTYLVVSVVVASLAGWGIIQQGMLRLRQALGPVVGGLLFVVLPVVCGALELLAGNDVVDLSTWPGSPWLGHLVRWYSPGLVAATLVAYGTWKARPREPGRFGRGLGLALVVAPYVLLMASLTFGVDAPWLNGPLGDAVEELGGGALAAQLVLAFLVSAPG